MADDPYSNPDPYATPTALNQSPMTDMVRAMTGTLPFADPMAARVMAGQYQTAFNQREQERKEIEGKQQLNVDQMSKLLDETAAAIKRSREGRTNLPMLALGAGLMGPGNFGEQMSRGLSYMIPAIQQQRQEEDQTDLELAKIGLKKGEIQNMPLDTKLKYLQALQLGDMATIRAIETGILRSAPALEKVRQPQIKGNLIYDPTTGKFKNLITGRSFDMGAGGGDTLNTPQERDEANRLNKGDGSTQGVNEDYLKTLDPGYAAYVRAVARGEKQFPGDRGKLSQEQIQLLEDVKKYDPTFSTLDYNMRANTLKDFTSGQAARNVSSLNTAIQHMGKLHELATKLKNKDFPDWNAAVNWYRKKTGSDLPTNFMAAAHPVAEEISRVFKGSNLSDAEIKAWEQTLTPNMSPDQIQGAMETLQELLNGRINALGDQYARGMGKHGKPFQILDDKSAKILEHIHANPIPGSRGAKQAPGTAAPGVGKPWERYGGGGG